MLVDVGELAELRGIEADDGATRIGGGVTVGELLASPARHRAPAGAPGGRRGTSPTS